MMKLNICLYLILCLMLSCVQNGDDVSSRYITVCIDGIKYHTKGQMGHGISVAINKATMFPMRCKTNED